MSEHTRARADTDSQRQFIDEQILGIGPRPALIKSLANAHKREEHLRHVNRDLLAALKWFSNRFHTNAEVAKQWAGSCSMSTAEWQDWEARVAAAIAKAELPA